MILLTNFTPINSIKKNEKHQRTDLTEAHHNLINSDLKGQSLAQAAAMRKKLQC